MLVSTMMRRTGRGSPQRNPTEDDASATSFFMVCSEMEEPQLHIYIYLICRKLKRGFLAIFLE